MITAVGIFGIEFILDYTFIPAGIFTLFLMGITLRNYKYLIESDDDDDD